MRRFEIHVYTDHPDPHAIVCDTARQVAESLEGRAHVTAIEVRNGEAPDRLATYVIGGE